MSREATKEYILLMRRRYGVMETKRAKGKVLDEFCETTGLERKHSIKVLRSTIEPLRPAGREVSLRCCNRGPEGDMDAI